MSSLGFAFDKLLTLYLSEGMMIFTALLLIAAIIAFVKSKGRRALRTSCVVVAIYCVLYLGAIVAISSMISSNHKTTKLASIHELDDVLTFAEHKGADYAADVLLYLDTRSYTKDDLHLKWGEPHKSNADPNEDIWLLSDEYQLVIGYGDREDVWSIRVLSNLLNTDTELYDDTKSLSEQEMTGCATQEEGLPEVSIPFLAFEGEDEDSVNWLTGSWCIDEGQINISDDPIATIERKLFYHILWWTGGNNIALSPNVEKYTTLDPTYSINKVPREQLNGQTIATDEGSIQFTSLNDCYEIQINLSNGKETITDKLSHSYKINGNTISVEKDGVPACIGIEEDLIYVLFVCTTRDTSFICSAKIELDSLNKTWSEPTVFPEEWHDLPFYVASDTTVYIDKCVYFSSKDKVFCYDLEEESLTELSKLMKKVEAILGDKREGLSSNNPDYISLDSYKSGGETILIAYYPTPYNENRESYHLVYFLIWDGDFAGALDVNGTKIYVYDRSGNISQEYDISWGDFEVGTVFFPHSQYAY